MKNSQVLSWISRNTKKQRGALFALTVANVLFSVLSVLFALCMKTIIEGAEKSNYQKLIRGAIFLGVIIVLQFLFRIFINGLSERVRAKINWSLRSMLFSSILKKKYEKINGYHSGELLNRLTNDVPVVASGVTNIVPVIVSAFARLISAVVALVVLDWIFAVAFSVAGILVFLVISLMRNKLKILHKDIQKTEGRSRSFMQECVENLLAVKVFSVNGKVNSKSDSLLKDNYNVTMKRRNRSVLGNATYNFIFSAGYFFALVYGAVKIFRGVLDYGSLVAILQLVNNVQVPFASLSSVVPEYYSMVASAERIMEILKVEEEDFVGEISREDTYLALKSIEFSNVCFSYENEKVLDNASLSIKKGDFVAITGSSGAGKTTILKLLLGVYRPDEGEIYFDGAQKKEINETTRPLFSYVPQGNMLFSGTLRDNVTFAFDGNEEEKINSALEISCATEFVSELPDGLDTVVGEKGAGLSEGQVQRLALARAILSSAPVLILDESTSALDEKTEEKVLSNLKNLTEKTLIIVSHKKAPLSICNKKLEVVDGKIVSIELN